MTLLSTICDCRLTVIRNTCALISYSKNILSFLLLFSFRPTAKCVLKQMQFIIFTLSYMSMLKLARNAKDTTTINIIQNRILHSTECFISYTIHTQWTHKNVPFLDVYFTNTFTNIRQLVLNNRCLNSCMNKSITFCTTAVLSGKSANTLSHNHG